MYFLIIDKIVIFENVYSKDEYFEIIEKFFGERGKVKKGLKDEL